MKNVIVPRERFVLSPNRNRIGFSARILLVHHSGGPADAEALVEWMATRAAKVSYHLSIGKRGDLWQSVPLNQRGWHAGESEYFGEESVNGFAIGVALCNDGYSPFTEPQLETLGKVQHLIGLPLVGHREVCQPEGRKPDPHDGFPWERFRPHLPHRTRLVSI